MSTHKVTALDPSKLVRVESITDPAAGWLDINQPIYEDGSPDPYRPVTYYGRTSLNFAGGQSMPVVFLIEAKNRLEAIKLWTSACQSAVDKILSEITRQQILSASGKPM